MRVGGSPVAASDHMTANPSESMDKRDTGNQDWDIVVFYKAIIPGHYIDANESAYKASVEHETTSQKLNGKTQIFCCALVSRNDVLCAHNKVQNLGPKHGEKRRKDIDIDRVLSLHLLPATKEKIH